MKLIKMLVFMALVLALGMSAGLADFAKVYPVEYFEPGVPAFVDEIGGYVWRNLDGTFPEDFDYGLLGGDFLNQVNNIRFHMRTDKWMDEDWEELYLSEGFTKDALCVAISVALDGVEGDEWVSEACKASYRSYLNQNGFGQPGYEIGTPSSYHGALIRDLGDESIPMYALCSLAAIALGGAMFARKKRVCA